MASVWLQLLTSAAWPCTTIGRYWQRELSSTNKDKDKDNDKDKERQGRWQRQRFIDMILGLIEIECNCSYWQLKLTSTNKDTDEDEDRGKCEDGDEHKAKDEDE